MQRTNLGVVLLQLRDTGRWHPTGCTTCRVGSHRTFVCVLRFDNFWSLSRSFIFCFRPLLEVGILAVEVWCIFPCGEIRQPVDQESIRPVGDFLGHLLRDDLINPVKMSVRPYVRMYVRTSTIKLNAATNQIVVFVKVHETFTTIWLSRSSKSRSGDYLSPLSGLFFLVGTSASNSLQWFTAVSWVTRKGIQPAKTSSTCPQFLGTRPNLAYRWKRMPIT